jgi:uncharacterized membrane protein YgcG
MEHFPSTDLLAQNFIKAYFTTLAYRINNLEKFYHANSTRARNGQLTRRPDGTYPRDFHLHIPAGATLTVINHTITPLSPNTLLLVVTGALENQTPATRSAFVINFVLLSENGKIWITSEVFQTIDDQFYTALGSDQFYDVPNDFSLGNDTRRSPRAARPKAQDAEPAKPPPAPARPPPAEPKPEKPPAESAPRPASRGGRGRGNRGGRGRRGGGAGGGEQGGHDRFFYSPDSS